MEVWHPRMGQDFRSPLGIQVYLCLGGPGHQFFDLGLDLLSFRILFPRLPVLNTLPCGDHNIIMRVILCPKRFAWDITLWGNSFGPQFPEYFCKIWFFSLLHLPIDDDPHCHVFHLPIFLWWYQVSWEISSKIILVCFHIAFRFVSEWSYRFKQWTSLLMKGRGEGVHALGNHPHLRDVLYNFFPGEVIAEPGITPAHILG